MSAPIHIAPGRFEAVLYASRAPAEATREAYLASPTGKARKAISKAVTLAGQLQNRVEEVGIALTRGDGSEASIIRMNAVLLDLRIACGDVEALVRLVEADR